ncbi:c-type cytochrome [Pleionea sediminis]|uniref:c-type cytochrome n=1 Tax=Pleionea sediminis TaxID=2569479 RepID=UPI0011863430|nr:c-type cytochrome [Pleionea sediminis]
MNSFKNKWLFIVLSAFFTLGLAEVTANDEENNDKSYEKLKQEKLIFSEKNVRERTAPVGSIYVEGDDVPAAAPPPVAESTGPKDGKTVYSTYCSACHADGIGGAPKFGDASVWSSRVEASGMEGLVSSVINGKGIMPPKGGCANCSDDELKKAVEHMVSSAQ